MSSRQSSVANHQAINDWIRTSKAYDGVIDFDAIMRASELMSSKKITTEDTEELIIFSMTSVTSVVKTPAAAGGTSSDVTRC